ncbi:putative zinc-binding metallopeptidase [Hyphomicrobium sp. 802]|uniref:zinc-binding metallopeptidase family protein n=1 Tax=Hyphomicrobium sp. 802 TaxID=1112272 RepID=UPI00045E9859|nr:putative zinc-binding metallopeptidase [Hyphomicrobium sp. 802]
MKNFACANCGNTVYFENVTCVKCGSTLGFDSAEQAIVAIADAGLSETTPDVPIFRKLNAGPDDVALRYCANAEFGVCNWLTPDSESHIFCKACDLNRIIPNLSEPGSLLAWRAIEHAKKRLVYSLLRFGLPFDGSASTKGPLTFDFVRNALTGHLDGVVTIDVSEADAVERERQRQQFDEPYRSLLGHLRHESGHYYWMVLVEEAGRLEEFREIFGDERDDYDAALARHHANGPAPDWQEQYVSAYASAHPWEDWAETWAHYLHMVDALDTAAAEGMEGHGLRLDFRDDIYSSVTFGALMARWIPLTIAMNSLSRSMGHDDFYPFVIPEPAYDKLAFVHRMIHERIEQQPQEPAALENAQTLNLTP